jgi:hypothetical protein
MKKNDPCASTDMPSYRCVWPVGRSGRVTVGRGKRCGSFADRVADPVLWFALVETVFAQTPTPSVQNAAWLAPTQLSRIFDKRILEKIITVTSGVVVVTTKNQPAVSTANHRPPVGTKAFVARSSQLESADKPLRSRRVWDRLVSLKQSFRPIRIRSNVQSGGPGGRGGPVLAA